MKGLKPWKDYERFHCHNSCTQQVTPETILGDKVKGTHGKESMVVWCHFFIENRELIGDGMSLPKALTWIYLRR